MQQENTNSQEKLILDARKTLSLSAVETVDGFNEQMLKLTVNGSKVQVFGENIKISRAEKDGEYFIFISCENREPYKFYDLMGYNFVGFHASKTPLANGTTLIVTSLGFMSGEESLGEKYKQDFGNKNADFYFRDYTLDGGYIYLYPVYEVKQVTINYYYTTDNGIDSDDKTFANNTSKYVAYPTPQVNTVFNAEITLPTLNTMVGYESIGWNINPQTVEFSNYTSSINSFVDKNIYAGANTGIYEQNWLSGANLYMRYDDQEAETLVLNVYAYYKPIEYTLYFYYRPNSLTLKI